jgi:hypothetical protein
MFKFNGHQVATSFIRRGVAEKFIIVWNFCSDPPPDINKINV